MKQVTVNIPEGKYEFFMELFRRLGLSTADGATEIPEWQKEMTLSRLAELEKNPNQAVDFDSMVNDLEQKYGL